MPGKRTETWIRGLGRPYRKKTPRRRVVNRRISAARRRIFYNTAGAPLYQDKYLIRRVGAAT
jgi:hypothetical protein